MGLNLNRDDFYQELDFFISSSYGPGRYDSNYEDSGRLLLVMYVGLRIVIWLSIFG